MCNQLLNVQSIIKNESMLICKQLTNRATNIMVLTKTWHTASLDLPLRRATLSGYNIRDLT